MGGEEKVSALSKNQSAWNFHHKNTKKTPVKKQPTKKSK